MNLSGRIRSSIKPRSCRQSGGIEEKLVIVVLVGVLVLGFSVANNFVEKSKVIGLLNDHLSQGNVHVLHDQQATKKTLEDAIIAKIGDKDVEVYLYHFQPEIRLSDLRNPDSYPRLGGVTKVGDYLSVSTLVARAWWVQKQFFYKDQDVHVTKFLILPPERIGPAYGPPPGDLDFVGEPAVIIDSQR